MAALFTSWEAYRTGGPLHETLCTGEDTMSRAIRLVEWHQDEVARLAGGSGATDKARHASHLAQVIARAMAAPASAEGRYPFHCLPAMVWPSIQLPIEGATRRSGATLT